MFGSMLDETLGRIGRVVLAVALLVAMCLGILVVGCIRQDAREDERARIETGADITVRRIERRHEQIERDAARGGDAAVDGRLRDGTFLAAPLSEGGGDPAGGPGIHPGGAGPRSR